MKLTDNISRYICLDTKFFRYLRDYSLLLLFALLTIDFVFMGLHALKSLGYIQDPNMSVTQNWGYPESFQYIKALVICGIFIYMGSRFGKALFFSWAAVYLYVLLDDSFEIHEMLGYRLGEYITRNLEIGAGSTTGEFLVLAGMGAIIFLPLFYFYFHSRNKNLKVMSQDMFILFGGIMFFGMGLDVLHDFAATGSVLNGILGLAEDGGEMVVMSFVLWYSWTFLQHDPFTRRVESPRVIRATPIQSTRDRAPYPKPQRKEKDKAGKTI